MITSIRKWTHVLLFHERFTRNSNCKSKIGLHYSLIYHKEVNNNVPCKYFPLNVALRKCVGNDYSLLGSYNIGHRGIVAQCVTWTRLWVQLTLKNQLFISFYKFANQSKFGKKMANRNLALISLYLYEEKLEAVFFNITSNLRGFVRLL